MSGIQKGKIFLCLWKTYVYGNPILRHGTKTRKKSKNASSTPTPFLSGNSDFGLSSLWWFLWNCGAPPRTVIGQTQSHPKVRSYLMVFVRNGRFLGRCSSVTERLFGTARPPSNSSKAVTRLSLLIGKSVT